MTNRRAFEEYFPVPQLVKFENDRYNPIDAAWSISERIASDYQSRWLLWQSATAHQRELCLQVAGAVFAFATPSREVDATELTAIVDRVLGND